MSEPKPLLPAAITRVLDFVLVACEAIVNISTVKALGSFVKLKNMLKTPFFIRQISKTNVVGLSLHCGKDQRTDKQLADAPLDCKVELPTDHLLPMGGKRHIMWLKAVT